MPRKLKFYEHLAACRRGPDECWNWPIIGKDGYTTVHYGGRYQRGHRAVYQELVGPIPVGLELDHLCRHPGCVNPAHLEPVLPRVNKLRGVGAAAINARKTTCRYGHPLTAAKGRRKCRVCALAAQSRWQAARTHCRNGHEYAVAGTRTDASGRRICRGCELTHCKRGHPFDMENTAIEPNGSRRCRACCRERARKHRAA